MDPPLLLTYNDYIFIGYIYNLTLALSPHPNCMCFYFGTEEVSSVYVVYTLVWEEQVASVHTCRQIYLFYFVVSGLQRLAWEITRSCRQICYLWTWDNDWWMFVLGNQNNLLAQNNFARKRARMQNTECGKLIKGLYVVLVLLCICK